MGKSGRCSRNRDSVRFGMPLLILSGVAPSATGAAGCGWVAMESRDVFENDDGPELLFGLTPHRKMEVQEMGPLDELLSDPLRGVSGSSGPW